MILEAAASNEALDAGYAEAEAYASENSLTFLGRIDCYEIDENNKYEIYSTLMSSSASPNDYIDLRYKDEEAHASNVSKWLNQ